MREQLVIRGATCQIRWSYRIAAEVKDYVITVTDRGDWCLRGALMWSDAFLVEQQPLTVFVAHGASVGTWAVASLEVNEGRVVAALTMARKR